jgi:hypothetical protein
MSDQVASGDSVRKLELVGRPLVTIWLPLLAGPSGQIGDFIVGEFHGVGSSAMQLEQTARAVASVNRDARPELVRYLHPLEKVAGPHYVASVPFSGR